MNKNYFFCLLLSLVTYACSSSKKIVTSKPTEKTTLANKVVWTAVTYKGTPYRFGGTSKYGMDCSGLIFTSFKQRGIVFPRVTYQMAKQGKQISLKEVNRGDLLFFKTAKKGEKINHVGLVTSTNSHTIKFIHATSSRGVIVSSLKENYWKNAFIKAKRVF